MSQRPPMLVQLRCPKIPDDGQWRRRESVDDAPIGPKERRSSVLSKEEEALVVIFRRHTLLPLDDCLYALESTIPHLTRTSLHRCFVRHEISRLPKVEGSKPKAAFTEPTGGGGKPADIRRMRAAGEPCRCHSFELACADLEIEHRLTKPNHPWTNGEVERMNRRLKETTVRRYHYETHEGARAHLTTFLEAYNFARRMKTLQGLTPFEFIAQQWTSEPRRFRLHQDHLIPGPSS